MDSEIGVATVRVRIAKMTDNFDWMTVTMILVMLGQLWCLTYMTMTTS